MKILGTLVFGALVVAGISSPVAAQQWTADDTDLCPPTQNSVGTPVPKRASSAGYVAAMQLRVKGVALWPRAGVYTGGPPRTTARKY
jgi:hypothetical protein